MQLLHDPIVYFDTILNVDNPANYLGNKGANLHLLYNNGVRVPYGFIITQSFYALLKQNPLEAKNLLLNSLEKTTKKLPDKTFRFLSVRSSPFVSLPGLLDTVLNLPYDYNDLYLKEDEQLQDSKVLQMFLKTLASSDGILLKILSSIDIYNSIVFNHFSLNGNTAENIINIICKLNTRWKRLKSKNNCLVSAQLFDFDLPIIIQTGINPFADSKSGNGVMFTHNPLTGSHTPIIEYSINNQADVVGGIVTDRINTQALKTQYPHIFNSLLNESSKIEKLYDFPQDIEFTVSKNNLYVLQTRNLAMSSKAIEGKCNKLNNVDLLRFSKYLDLANTTNCTEIFNKKTIEPQFHGNTIVQGVTTGLVTYKTHDIKNDNIIIADKPKRGMSREAKKLRGVVTISGGKTSHLAVLCQSLKIPYINNVNANILSLKKVLPEGSKITIDANTGNIYKGTIKIHYPKINNNPIGNIYGNHIRNQFSQCFTGLSKIQITKLTKKKHLISKSNGLKLLNFYGLPVPPHYINSIPPTNVFPRYSIRSSFSEQNLTKATNLELPSVFGVSYLHLHKMVRHIKKEFVSIFNTSPEILIHETHPIIFCGNLTVNHLTGKIECEYWKTYNKSIKPCNSITLNCSCNSLTNLLLPFSLCNQAYILPFINYTLEFIITNCNQLYFTEIIISD